MTREGFIAAHFLIMLMQTEVLLYLPKALLPSLEFSRSKEPSVI